MKTTVTRLVVLLGTLAFAACDGVAATDPAVGAQGVTTSITPPGAILAPSQRQAFAATVTGTANLGVTWQVLEGAIGGGITSTGLYTAPLDSGTFHVVATSVADPAKSATATVTVSAQLSGSCAAEALRTTGKTYYVCSCDAGAASGCVAGNDSSGSGTAGAPWKSITKAQAQFKAMNGGDTVALCQGGSWGSVPDTGYWDNSRCSASATCDLREYPTSWGAGIKPRISMSSGNFFTAKSAGGGYRLMNLAISGGQYGIWVWDGVHDVDACGLSIDGASIGMYVGGLLATSANNRLRQSVVTNCSAQGWLGACTNCLVDGNVFRNNGGTSNRNHNIYIGTNCASSSCYAPVGMRVTNNDVSLSAGSSGSCQSVEIVVHDPQHGTVIENNYIHETPGTGSGGCYGIQVNSGGDVIADFTGLVIRRNRVATVGGYRVVSWAEAPNAIVEDNVVVCEKECSALMIDEPYTKGPSGSVMNTANTVRNNTVYYPSGTKGGDAITVNTEGSGHVVTGNVVVSYSDQTGAPFNCFNNNLSAGSYAFVGNNACWKSAGNVGSNAGVTVGNGAAPPSLTALFVAPDTNLATADFTPASGSPLIGQASTTYSSSLAVTSGPWSASDNGKVRVNSPTDIGAYER